MKKYLIKFGIGAVILMMASCNLDRYPESETRDKEYNTTEQGVIGGAIAAYNGLQAVANNAWRFSELRSDNSRVQSTSSGAQSNVDLKLSDQLAQTYDMPMYFDNSWKPSYNLIYRCNEVLSNVNVVRDPKLRAKIKSEMLFIRSLVYFDLVRLYGDVWLVTTPISGKEALALGKSSVDKIYEQIITDLELAASEEGGLPYPIFTTKSGVTKQPSAEVGRATIYSAKAILAKVYLTRKNYTKAKSLCNDIISDYGTSALVPYANVFGLGANKKSKEILFAVSYKSGGTKTGNPMPNYFYRITDNGIVGTGDGFNTPTDDLCQKFGITTNWLYTTVANPQPDKISSFTPSDLTTVADKRAAVCLKIFDFGPTSTTNDWCCNKYYSPVTVRYDGDNDYPVIRYADVLLMYAEILNTVDDDREGAATHINLIRSRAGLADLTSADKTSKESLHTALLLERRLEFAFENQRWFDMLREGNDYVLKITNDMIYGNPVTSVLPSDKFYQSFQPQNMPLKADAANILLPVPLNMESLY